MFKLEKQPPEQNSEPRDHIDFFQVKTQNLRAIFLICHWLKFGFEPYPTSILSVLLKKIVFLINCIIFVCLPITSRCITPMVYRNLILQL